MPTIAPTSELTQLSAVSRRRALKAEIEQAIETGAGSLTTAELQAQLDGEPSEALVRQCANELVDDGVVVVTERDCVTADRYHSPLIADGGTVKASYTADGDSPEDICDCAARGEVHFTEHGAVCQTCFGKVVDADGGQESDRRWICEACESVVRARWFGPGSFAVGCGCQTVPVVPQMGQGETPEQWHVERPECCAGVEVNTLDPIHGELGKDYQCGACGAKYDWDGEMVEAPTEPEIRADGGQTHADPDSPRKTIIDTLSSHGRVGLSELALAAEVGRSYNTTCAALGTLEEGGLVEQVGDGSPQWRLTEAGERHE